MLIDLPAAVGVAIQKLNAAGYEAYVVGGCVRDSLMGNNPDDWDITTSATPQEMQGVFADCRTIETGLQHGTLTVIINGMSLEITTYRVDGTYSDGRHPDNVTFSRLLAEDLRRRDFTINAMAYHPVKGIVDLYEGQDDLSCCLVRCVGDPQMRFSEDALRILRALRFASVLGFRIDVPTGVALRDLSPSLRCVSIERIATELNKLLCGVSVQRILCDYADVLAWIVPEIKQIHDFYLLSLVPPTRVARWAALFWCGDVATETAQRILRDLRMDNRTIRGVVSLLSCKGAPYHSDSDLLWLLNRLDSEQIWDYLTLCGADGERFQRVEYLLAEQSCYKISMLAVSGEDLSAVGVVNGPMMGFILNELLTAVIDGRCVNDKMKLLEYVQTIKKPVQ